MAIIATFPTTLVNGTTGDATQVMSLFNFIQTQVNSNALADVGGTLTGNLTIQPTTGAALVTVTSPASQSSSLYLNVTGGRQWAVINNGSGFYIQDVTGTANDFYIVPGGATTVAQSLTVGTTLQVNSNATVSGNFNTNAITGTTITGSTGSFSGGQISITGGNAVCYFTSNGVREWYVGAINNGQFYFTDQSANIVTAAIGNGNGQWTWNYPATFGSNLLVNGNEQVNGNITCSGSIIGNQVTGNGVTSNGNMNAVGTISGATVTGNITAAGNGVFYNITGDTIAWHWAANFVTVYQSGINRGTIAVTPSDERLKRNIRDLEDDPLDQLCQLDLISYDMADIGGDGPDTHVRVGFSAQQIGTVIPDAVIRSPAVPYDESRTTYGEDEVRYSYDSNALLARCVGAIQQLSTRVALLEARLSAEGR